MLVNITDMMVGWNEGDQISGQGLIFDKGPGTSFVQRFDLIGGKEICSLASIVSHPFSSICVKLKGLQMGDADERICWDADNVLAPYKERNEESDEQNTAAHTQNAHEIYGFLLHPVLLVHPKNTYVLNLGCGLAKKPQCS